MQRVLAIDSHTGGEPTRVIIDGGPALESGTLADRVKDFRNFHDDFRSGVILEPRGTDVLVGALLVPPIDSSCAAGVIFFNNTGYLGMCGHGMIGVVVTLGYLGRLKPGRHRVESPVGIVEVEWHGGASVSVFNVPSYRAEKDLLVEVPGIGAIRGDIAWGGNWFFLSKDHGAELSRERVPALLDLTSRIRQAVNTSGHAEVDHVELVADSNSGADARNFVLCPGGAYDRSPCGTGTSAKLACLAADGTLAEGAPWIQESIIGSRFRGSFAWADRAKGTIIPTISGEAYVTGETTLLFHEADPFRWGIR
jgi:proline racemase